MGGRAYSQYHNPSLHLLQRWWFHRLHPCTKFWEIHILVADPYTASHAFASALDCQLLVGRERPIFILASLGQS